MSWVSYRLGPYKDVPTAQDTGSVLTSIYVSVNFCLSVRQLSTSTVTPKVGEDNIGSGVVELDVKAMIIVSFPR